MHGTLCFRIYIKLVMNFCTNNEMFKGVKPNWLKGVKPNGTSCLHNRTKN